ncbi:MAG: hypothetical protein ABEH88_06525 [Halobacteriales archaeon]
MPQCEGCKEEVIEVWVANTADGTKLLCEQCYEGDPSRGDSHESATDSSSTDPASSEEGTDNSARGGEASSVGPISTDSSDSGDASVQSDAESSPDTELRDDVDDMLDAGDDLHDEATDYRNAGEDDRALEAYDNAQSIYEEAHELANQGDLVDTDEIERKLAVVRREQRDIHRRHLQSKIESLRDDLTRVDSLIDNDEFVEARDRLSDVESRLEAARETAVQHSVEDLRDEITTLEQLHQARLEEIIEINVTFANPRTQL